MSVAIRTLLAVLVMLPPGTFRTLDSLITRKKKCDRTAVAQVNQYRELTSGPGVKKDSPEQCPGIPQRVRSWTKTTFLASSEADRVFQDGLDGFHGPPMTLELSEDQRGQWKSVESVPSLNAHLSARGLLLALGELLV